MGSCNFRNGIRGNPISACPLDSVASYLMCADVRTFRLRIMICAEVTAPDGAHPISVAKGAAWFLRKKE